MSIQASNITLTPAVNIQPTPEEEMTDIEWISKKSHTNDMTENPLRYVLEYKILSDDRITEDRFAEMKQWVLVRLLGGHQVDFNGTLHTITFEENPSLLEGNCHFISSDTYNKAFMYELVNRFFQEFEEAYGDVHVYYLLSCPVY
jgi:hypothetical protein